MQSTNTPDNGLASGLNGMLKAYDKMIASYDLVIQDLSGDIYDPALQAQKEPVLKYLKTMRAAWVNCRDDFKRQVDAMK